MLFPPLDDEPSSHDGSGSNCGNQVLPQNLRDRFSHVRSLLREKARTEDSSSATVLKRKQEQAALETAKAVQDEMARLQNGIAELEAMYTQQQQERQQELLPQQLMQGGDGIDSDVEDAGDEEDDGEGGGIWDNHNNAAIAFQALPSLVNAVEPDLDDNLGRSNAGEGDQAGARESDPLATTGDILCDA